MSEAAIRIQFLRRLAAGVVASLLFLPASGCLTGLLMENAAKSEYAYENLVWRAEKVHSPLIAAYTDDTRSRLLLKYAVRRGKKEQECWISLTAEQVGKEWKRAARRGQQRTESAARDQTARGSGVSRGEDEVGSRAGYSMMRLREEFVVGRVSRSPRWKTEEMIALELRSFSGAEDLQDGSVVAVRDENVYFAMNLPELREVDGLALTLPQRRYCAKSNAGVLVLAPLTLAVDGIWYALMGLSAVGSLGHP